MVIGVCESRVSQLRAHAVSRMRNPPRIYIGRLTARSFTGFPYTSLGLTPITPAAMTVPEPDSRVVPLDRPLRTEREPVTYEPRRTARHASPRTRSSTSMWRLGNVEAMPAFC